MADTPFPLPRQRRETEVLVGNGGATYGPFNDFSIFDPEDVKVLAKPAGGVSFLPVSGVVVTKTAADVYSPFTVTFPAAVPATTKFVVRGRRTPKRDVSVLRGGSISTPQLEAELSRIAATQQELVRDAENAWRSEPNQVGGYILGGEPDHVAVFDAAGNISRQAGFTVFSFLASVAQVASNVAATVQNRAASFAAASAAALSVSVAAGYASDAFTKGEVQVVSTVHGLPGLSIGAGVKALRFNGYAAQDDGFGWPLAVEVPIAPLADQPWHRVSNSGTRRWQLQAQEVLLEWFGGKGDAVYSQNAFTSGTDNYPAYVAAEAFLAATNPQRSVDANLGGRVLLGYGAYYSSQSWNLKHRMEIIGKNGGSGSAATRYNTALVFPKDVTGIYVNRGDTSYDLKVASTTSAGSTYLEGFTVIAIDGGTDRTKHGIRFRALCEAYGVNVLNFAGDGINIVATSGSSDDSRHGNANYSKITNGRMANCHNGVNIEGADANACTLLAVNTGGPRAWGIRDASFLGNTIVGGGSQSGSTLSRCFYNGNRYWAGPAGAHETPGSTNTLYNTTTPGTNPEVWTLWDAGAGGGNLREWTPGNTLEWTFGGSLCILNSNSKTTVFGGYFGESNEAPFYINPNSAGASYGGLRSGGGGGFHPLSGGRVDFQGTVASKAIKGTALTINGGANPVVDIVLTNNGTLATGRGSRFAGFMGLKADGITPRPVGALLGRNPAAGDLNSAVALQYYETTAGTWATGLEVMGAGTKRIEPGADNLWALGSASLRFTQLFAASATISTSDECSKQQIEDIPDEWLDAWSGVQFKRFKFNDAVGMKGDEARWHTGLVAQRVADAFVDSGIDPYSIGLVCYDEWGDETEEAEDGSIRVTREAGSLYGIRYEEAFAIEAAYQRRRMDRIEAMQTETTHV